MHVKIVKERKFKEMIEVTKDGRTTIDNTVKLRLEDLFSIENTIFLFKIFKR